MLESLVRREPAQRLPWPVVHQVRNRIERVLIVLRQFRALVQELPHQPIGVLATAALPGSVRITKVHPHVRGLGQLLMACHPLALVVVSQGQRNAFFRLQLRVSYSHRGNLPQVRVLHFGVEIAEVNLPVLRT